MTDKDIQLPRYRPSGAMHLSIVPYTLAAIAVAAVVGVVYGVLMALNPFVIGDIFLVFGLGFAAGVIAQLACRYAHCRNPLTSLMVAVFLGVAALVASYWINYRFDSNTTNASREGTAFTFGQWVDARKEAGWIIKGGQINGPYVTIVWGFEAFFVLALASMIGWQAGKEPYCEQCKTWPKSHKTSVKGHGTEEFWKAAKTGAPLVALNLTEGTCADVSLELDALICDKCHTGFLNVYEERLKASGGKSEKIRKPVTEGILIDQTSCASFLAAPRSTAVA
jgi:hypothetical protein